ncbi:L-dopachrome tautomerase-related protein [Nonlabens marinus]|uniref:Major royal jelly protein n=1 Tax=Nonlabens marinus S1-08 TaxID=1454201 RepID=W8VSA9_9FLAO|nr:L-dopachrome tautomerase-related protein [Nonlabens marinus]BAO56769.1 hypothetical protein NMS_2760 [Nonlabens marinus S1-08]
MTTFIKNIFVSLLLVTFLNSCKENTSATIPLENSQPADSLSQPVTQVASFTGQQVTGVTVSDDGRIFVNFPRWRKGVENSVIEIKADQSLKSYPNDSWNAWEIGQPTQQDQFVGVQSVIAFENELYIIDTRSVLFQEVLDAPRIYVFDLETDNLKKTYTLGTSSYFPDSYINDLRVDPIKNLIYLTDSGHAGLIVLDRETGASRRILNEHQSTKAEQSYLTFDNQKWKGTIHSDGIALDAINNRLYYHALTAYSLYSISTDDLLTKSEKAIEQSVVYEGKTAAPDGMILDSNGNLYFADLENNKIQYRKPDGTIHTLVEGDQVSWADTFSIYNNELYYTNSRINEATGDISDMTFTLNKTPLPGN